MRILIFLVVASVHSLCMAEMSCSYSAKDHTLFIPAPKSFAVAPRKVVVNHDRGRRAGGGTTDNRFVLFVRNGSLDPSGVQGDTLSVSVNEYSDAQLSLEEFTAVKEGIIEGSRQSYSQMPNVTFEKVEQDRNWTMASFTMKIVVPASGRRITCYIYAMTGMVLVDGHMYTYVCQLYDAAESVKSEVRRNLKTWLESLPAANSKKMVAKAKARPHEAFDLLSVGLADKGRRQYLPDSYYSSLRSDEWKIKRTFGQEKASGIDVQFKYPARMSCDVGNQPHVAFCIQDIVDQKVHLGVNIGVFPFDEALMQIIRESTPEDAEDPEFFGSVKEAFGPKDEMVGCGITKLEGQNVLWVTVLTEGERLGVKIRMIRRMFMIPTTGGKCLCPSFGVGLVGGDEYPVQDFERFLGIGMRMINSITFMDKDQIKHAEKIDAMVSGTGWFVTSEHVVTCWHVIEGKSDFGFIWPNGRRGKLALVGRDEFSDLAILKIAEEGSACATSLRLSSDKPFVSQKVFTVGYPLADYMGKAPKYTEGVVSALSGSGDDESMLQTTTPIQCGNSGGPLLNEKCEVVGVMQSKLDLSESLKSEIGSVQNVNYAVKAHLLRRLAHNLGIALVSDEVPVAAKNNYERVKKATVFIYAK